MGKLAKWLRLLGYDTTFFTGKEDSQMVDIALAENRIILTRDTHILKRRPVTGGRIKAVLIKPDNPESQIQQVIEGLNLHNHTRPFVLCLECNQPLIARDLKEVKERVPPYVFQTQKEYMECPGCQRIYWRGTHWQAMTKKLQKIAQTASEKSR